MQYPVPPHRPRAYHPPITGQRQYVVRGATQHTGVLSALRGLFRPARRPGTRPNA
jgi:hypothetical protein